MTEHSTSSADTDQALADQPRADQPRADEPRADQPRAEPPGALLGDALMRDEGERLGRLIRSARGERYSLEALAARSGVSAGLLSQIERGIGNPSFQTLLRVAHALDIPVAELLADGAKSRPESSFVVRSHERRHITWPKEGMSWEILSVPGQREFTALLGR